MIVVTAHALERCEGRCRRRLLGLSAPEKLKAVAALVEGGKMATPADAEAFGQYLRGWGGWTRDCSRDLRPDDVVLAGGVLFLLAFRGGTAGVQGGNVMHVEFNLPTLEEWVAGWPPWAWVILAVVGYYAATGPVVRLLIPATEKNHREDRAFLWMFSPILLMVVIVVGVPWVVLHFLSFGCVPAPWKK